MQVLSSGISWYPGGIVDGVWNGQMNVNPAGACSMKTAWLITVPRPEMTLLTPWVVSNFTIVGFSHASETTLYGSTVAPVKACVRNPLAPREATYSNTP